MGTLKYLSEKNDYIELTTIESLALSFIKNNNGATRKEIKNYLNSISENELQNVLLTLGEKNFIGYQII